MRKIFRLSIVLLLFSVYHADVVMGQDSPMVRVTTTDGNVFLGSLISENEKEVQVEVSGIGIVTIERSKIRSIERLSTWNIRYGVYWHDNPQPTRYFFSTNAIGMKKGKWYYQNTWILFNNVNSGITDNISLGAGIIPLFLFGGTPETPFWLIPKVTYNIPESDFHIGSGALIGGVLGSDVGGFGIVFGNLTYGNTDRNVTLGLGYGYAGSTWATRPVLNLNGMTRISLNWYLLGESYFVPGVNDGGVAILGARYAPERFAFDFGIIMPLDGSGELVSAPWLGITIPFGKGR
jgi:hypothetical protein